MSSLHYPILGTETYRFCCYSGVESATLLIIAILAIKKIIQGKNFLGPVPRYNNSSNVTMIPELNCKICLKSAGLYEFFDWFCVVLFEGKSSSKNASTSMVCLCKKQSGSTSPGIGPRLVTHMKHYYKPVWPKYLHLCSLNNRKLLIFENEQSRECTWFWWLGLFIFFNKYLFHRHFL